jgi:uncharacterized protein YlzI (FlbEa/FlbD family)
MRGLIVFALLILTRPDGQPIWISKDAIALLTRGTHVTCPLPNSSHVQLTSGQSLCVRNSPEDIIKQIGKQ